MWSCITSARSVDDDVESAVSDGPRRVWRPDVVLLREIADRIAESHPFSSLQLRAVAERADETSAGTQ